MTAVYVGVNQETCCRRFNRTWRETSFGRDSNAGITERESRRGRGGGRKKGCRRKKDELSGYPTRHKLSSRWSVISSSVTNPCVQQAVRWEGLGGRLFGATVVGRPSRPTTQCLPSAGRTGGERRGRGATGRGGNGSGRNDVFSVSESLNLFCYDFTICCVCILFEGPLQVLVAVRSSSSAYPFFFAPTNTILFLPGQDTASTC